jgi:foldase protein PrsA
VKRLLPLLLAASALIGTACGSATPYAAKVNSQTITQKSLDAELKAIKANKAYVDALGSQSPVLGASKSSFNSTFVAQTLTEDIFLALVHEEVQKRHLVVTDDDRKAATEDTQSRFTNPNDQTQLLDKFPKSYRDQLIQRTAEVNLLEASIGGVKIDQPAIDDYYRSHATQYAVNCVSHILVDSQDAAAKLKSQLDAGANFADLAKANSKDNQGGSGGSAAQGGDLGCQPPGTYVQPFEDAVSKLQVGQVSAPVQTQFGWHIIKLTSRKEAPESQVSSNIRQAILAPHQEDFLNQIDKNLAKAKVVVSPKYGSFRKGDPSKGESPGVVPPNAPATASTTSTSVDLSQVPAPQGTP